MVVFSVATPEASGYFANGGSLGPIPDSPGGPPGSWGSPRDVTFTVSGLTGSVTSVRLMFTANHTFIGDLDVVLISPGNIRTHTIFSRTGAETAGALGSPGNLGGIYVFDDSAVWGWWNNVVNLTTSQSAAELIYQTSAPGPAPSPAPGTQINPAFAGLAPAQANGTWTLRFRDGTPSDVGAVTAATLHVFTGGIAAGHGSFDVDSLTDLAVVRNTSGAWMWYLSSSLDGFQAVPWGLVGNDAFVPADYDGDGRADIAVWRQGTFYVRLSSSQSLLAQPWGLATDLPLIGDFDGDGRADFAVYRPATSPGGQSFFYVKRSLDGALMAQPWGTDSDAVSWGDYDGDGKQDFAVRRPLLGGAVPATVHVLQSTAGYLAVQWGFAFDLQTPGDYDGDGRTDIAVARVESNQWVFYVRRSRDGNLFVQPWGATTDRVPLGDYTGDGKTDLVAWRPGPAPGGSVYYIRNSATGLLIVRPWGLSGDFTVIR